MIPDRLLAHLRTWLGDWPGRGPGLSVVGSAARERPGWDGTVHPLVGVADADGRGVLSVPSGRVAAVRAALAEGTDGVPAAAQLDGRFFVGVFRWSDTPTSLPDAGEWLPAADPALPEWLRPFGGDALVARDPETGSHLSAVGIKRHDPHGHELAVVTEQVVEGRGIGRRLVAQAARRVLDSGALPTYLHTTANVASAHLAAAAGFPDRGWSVLGVERE